MEPLNIVMPAVRSPAATLFLGATDAARRSTPLCINCIDGSLVRDTQCSSVIPSPDIVLRSTNSQALRDRQCVSSVRARQKLRR
jgi:hypothetical protein